MPKITQEGREAWTVEPNADFEAYFLADRAIQDGWFVSHSRHPRFGEGWLAYRDPVKTLIAWTTPDVPGILDQIDQDAERGLFSAGFVSFDAAPAFDQAFVSQRLESCPLACFHVYEVPPRFYKELLCSRPSAKLRIDWKPEMYRETYLSKCRSVHEHLARGDTYQVNLSLRFRGDLDANLASIFANLVAEDPPPYASLFMSEHAQVASLSPELFFERSGSRIRCRPMKGTAPLGSSPEETLANAIKLQASEKNRAENLMIVDMIRNDLGRIAEVGSVRAPSIFEVQAFPTVLQMTSTVEASITASLRETFKALFPCASIVGAPKVETLRIINRLENSPRGIYTGAIGTVSPNDQARFAVAIRTISGKPGSTERHYGAGSGIVWDSEPEAEWQETLLKTEALHQSSSEWSLFETFRWPDWDEAPRIELHLDRIGRSAEDLGIRFDRSAAVEALNAATIDASSSLRIRLVLTQRGNLHIQSEPLKPPLISVTAQIATTPVHSEDPSLRFKSNRRGIYDRALKQAGTEEALLWSEKGEVTEFCKGNFVAKIDGVLVTPPVACGLLPGVLRAILLQSGRISERIVSLEDLNRADEVWRVNSLTGMVPIRLVRDDTESLIDVD